MRLWEFDRLCKMEWENGEGRVGSLWLPEDSLRELQADIKQYALQGGGKFLPVHVDDLPRLREKDSYVMYALNPVDRKEVSLRMCRGEEIADVFFPDGYEAHVLSR